MIFTAGLEEFPELIKQINFDIEEEVEDEAKCNKVLEPNKALRRQSYGVQVSIV